MYDKMWTNKKAEKWWFCFLYVATLLKNGRAQVYLFYHLYFLLKLLSLFSAAIIILTDVQLIFLEELEHVSWT